MTTTRVYYRCDAGCCVEHGPIDSAVPPSRCGARMRIVYEEAATTLRRVGATADVAIRPMPAGATKLPWER